jgi:hypothetical protein
MKISKDIQQAQKDYPNHHYVINSNKVHSFKNAKTAYIDYLQATIQEVKFKTGFTPLLIKK